MAIKNIIFDIGNVLLRWSPIDIIKKTFPTHPDHETLTAKISREQLWYDLNLGIITEEDAIEQYHEILQISKPKLIELMLNIKESLTPLPGSLELLDKLYHAKLPLYSITDNVREIVEYIKNKYDFWPKFKGVVVSADIQVLKPAREIYMHLLDNYNLNPGESIFFDDLEPNVKGAREVGMHSEVFTNAYECEQVLKKLGVEF